MNKFKEFIVIIKEIIFLILFYGLFILSFSLVVYIFLSVL